MIGYYKCSPFILVITQSFFLLLFSYTSPMKTWSLFASALRHQRLLLNRPQIILPRCDYPRPPIVRRAYTTTIAVPHSSLPVIDFFASPKPCASYTLAHGASGFAKKYHYTTPDAKKRDTYCSIQIGEDAYFRRSDALGVADGVGGWSSVSSKVFSHYKALFFFYSCR